MTLSQLIYQRDVEAIREIIEDVSDQESLKEQIFFNARNGRNGLHEASSLGCLDILKLLLSIMTPSEALEAVHRGTWDRETCLSVACASEEYNYELVDYLLNMGMDPNAADRLGLTAVFHACQRSGKIGIIELLKTKGADLMRPSCYRFIPLDVAISRKDRELVNYFLEQYKQEKEKKVIFFTYALALHNFPDIVPTVLSLMGSAEIRKFLCDPYSTRMCRLFNTLVKLAKSEVPDYEGMLANFEIEQFIIKHLKCRFYGLAALNTDQALLMFADLSAFDGESGEKSPLLVHASSCQPIDEFALELSSAMKESQILVGEDSTSDETICDGTLLKFFPELDIRQRISLKSKARHVFRCHLDKKLGHWDAYNWLNTNFSAPGLKSYVMYEEVPFLIKEEDRI